MSRGVWRWLWWSIIYNARFTIISYYLFFIFATCTVEIEFHTWFRRYFLIDRFGKVIRFKLYIRIIIISHNTLQFAPATDVRTICIYACDVCATPHKEIVYTPKLGWTALRTWPFLKPNLVFAFSIGGLLFSIFYFIFFLSTPSFSATVTTDHDRRPVGRRRSRQSSPSAAAAVATAL